jgi:hypothetical protein
VAANFINKPTQLLIRWYEKGKPHGSMYLHARMEYINWLKRANSRRDLPSLSVTPTQVVLGMTAKKGKRKAYLQTLVK